MYLYGASGHAKVIIDILKNNGVPLNGIFDDDSTKKKLLEYDVLGKYEPSIVNDGEIIISIGDNRTRAKLSKIIINNFGTVIHTSSSVSENVIINSGTVVMHKAIIQSNAKIGKHVIINTAAVIEHDCIIDDFVHISPNATLCGSVKIGEGTHVSAAAIVIPGVNIGKWCIIGAGSVIISDIPDYVVVVGNPGKIIKNLK